MQAAQFNTTPTFPRAPTESATRHDLGRTEQRERSPATMAKRARRVHYVAAAPRCSPPGMTQPMRGDNIAARSRWAPDRCGSWRAGRRRQFRQLVSTGSPFPRHRLFSGTARTSLTDARRPGRILRPPPEPLLTKLLGLSVTSSPFVWQAHPRLCGPSPYTARMPPATRHQATARPAGGRDGPCAGHLGDQGTRAT
jgi:hypothetical protein